MSYKGVWGAAGIALASVVAVSVSAQAADLGEHSQVASYKDEPVYETPVQWSGPYVGGHLGAVWNNGGVDVMDPQGPAPVNHDIGGSSVLGGVHVGYNWRRYGLIAGLESDVSFADSLDYLASLRGRLGVATGAFLFYGTGGVAFAEADVSGMIPNAPGPVEDDVSDMEVGYVAGGGVEIKLSPNWSLGVEGLYYGFDSVSVHASPMDIEADADFGVVRGRVSYHFGPSYTPLK
jgi:outer membrane immunogenic protein